MTSRLRSRMQQRLRGADEGFTLIEVIVALTIFAMVVSASVGMLIAASRAALVAKMDTGAKNLAQQRLEQLRNLPFHIDHPTGAAAATVERDDLLDQYMTVYSATDAACKTTGFVHGGVATSSSKPAAGSVRCTYFGDPASGDFYRVANTSISGYPRYAQYVTVQFLSPAGAAGSALAVPSTYNTQGDPTTADVPVSPLVGARVTTLWTVGTTSKRNTLFSLVSQGRPAATSVSFGAQGSALEVTGRINASTVFDSQAGLVSANGSSTRNTTASTSAQSVFAALDPGDRINGACALASSGGAGTACVSPSSTGLRLRDAASNLVGSFANSSTTSPTQSTSNALPQVGTADASGNPTAVVLAQLDGTGSAPDVGGSSAGNTVYAVNTVAPVSGSVGDARLRMTTGKPLVYIDKSSAGSTTVCGNASSPTITGVSVASNPLFGATYGTTVGGTGHFASTCVAAQVRQLHLFPTDFAPEGIVRISFTAQATCRTNGGLYVAGTNPNGGQGRATYSGTAAMWDPTANGGLGAFGTPVAFGPSNPLSTALPTTTSLGSSGLTIGDYVSSWGSASAADITAGILIDQDNNAVNLKYANLLRIDSQTLLPADPNSSFGVLMGNMSCSAEDNR